MTFRSFSSSGWTSLFYNFLESDRRAQFVHKEKRHLGLTRRHILGFRRLLFGNVSELNDAVTDYQLMKFIMASVGANHNLPHGCQVKLSKVRRPATNCLLSFCSFCQPSVCLCRMITLAITCVWPARLPPRKTTSTSSITSRTM